MITSTSKTMRIRRPTVATVFATFLPACLWFSCAAAQSERAAEGAPSGALEEIIVTAQKREQNIQDVGMTITAFTGDDIRDFGFTNAQDLAKQTPALSFNLNANDDVSMTFSLRGVGLDDFSAFNEAPVAIYFDGVFPAMLRVVAKVSEESVWTLTAVFKTERLQYVRNGVVLQVLDIQ